MGEETPTDYYYEQLRKDLGRRHPKADPFLLDHLVSLEGFLDKSIVLVFRLVFPRLRSASSVVSCSDTSLGGTVCSLIRKGAKLW